MINTHQKLIRGFLGINNTDKTLSSTEDPTYLGFTLDFWFHPMLYSSGYHKAPSNLVMSSLLLEEVDSQDSSISYLEAIQEPERANYLRTFISTLQTIQEIQPWYFQSISGLNELLKPIPDGVTNRGKDKVLTIECLESIDNKMHFWADMYRYASYDRIWKRWMLPINKRRFGMQIIVTEFRNIQTVEDNIKEITNVINNGSPNYTEKSQYTQPIKPIAGNEQPQISSVNSSQIPTKNGADAAFYQTNTSQGGERKDTTPNISRPTTQSAGPQNVAGSGNSNIIKTRLKSIFDNMTFHIFRLYDCEFLFEDFPSFETITNTTPGDAAKFVFKIKVGDIEEHKEYGMMHFLLDDDVDQVPSNRLSRENYLINRNPYEILTHPTDEVKARYNNSTKSNTNIPNSTTHTQEAQQQRTDERNKNPLAAQSQNKSNLLEGANLTPLESNLLNKLISSKLSNGDKKLFGALGGVAGAIGLAKDFDTKNWKNILDKGTKMLSKKDQQNLATALGVYSGIGDAAGGNYRGAFNKLGSYNNLLTGMKNKNWDSAGMAMVSLFSKSIGKGKNDKNDAIKKLKKLF